ncbi:F-box/kelch-repeat protein At3g06240-like [Prosopis cineraria]|uniref:F-box/kelch-repeat protein At3g06240-like n=1 Tax=Prosopis cineraria TaxID=364024 RepID=UPI00240FBD1F|nr:F-box/kelch-repeat protein At3g06240-like [Prosopis cineraria]
MVLPRSSSAVTSNSSDQFNWVCSMSGFGFDSKNNDFKVVKIFLRLWERVTPLVEIYSLATAKWRSSISTGSRSGPSICSCLHGLTRDQIFINGSLHWLVCGCCNGLQRRKFILSFDLAGETFGELMMLPACLNPLASCHRLSLLMTGTNNSSLVLVHEKEVRWSHNNVFDIWVMREYGNVDSWNLIFSFDSSRLYNGEISRVIAMRSSGELVLQTYGNQTILLDPNKDSVVRCLGLEEYNVRFAGDYMEALSLINEENCTPFISSVIRTAG